MFIHESFPCHFTHSCPTSPVRRVFPGPISRRKRISSSRYRSLPARVSDHTIGGLTIAARLLGSRSQKPDRQQILPLRVSASCDVLLAWPVSHHGKQELPRLSLRYAMRAPWATCRRNISVADLEDERNPSLYGRRPRRPSRGVERSRHPRRRRSRLPHRCGAHSSCGAAWA